MIPSNLLAAAVEQGRAGWLDTLQATIARCAEQWSLRIGAPFQPGGSTSWVAPATGADGRPVVLKIVWSHPEAEHEADGLREWAGDGAVLIYADDTFADTIVLLIEQCVPGTPLAALPEPAQDEVVADLLRRLWTPPRQSSRISPLEQMCEFWAAESQARYAGRPDLLDPGLARTGLDLFRSLPASTPTRTLLCTDLHAENVLSAEREPWLMIDPKPYVGDPTYDALQHMLNCEQRLHADPRAFAARMADLLGLELDRLLLWLFARCVQEAPEWPGMAEVAQRIAP